MLKLVYFAWVRERVGRTEEFVEPPPGVATVSDLVGWLRQRGDTYAYAFENVGIVRAAIDRVHSKPEGSIAGAKEVAFFPPMTGG